MKNIILFLALCFLTLSLLPVSAWAEDTAQEEMDEDAQIAEALLNPLSYLWLAFLQNDTIWYDGDILKI